MKKNTFFRLVPAARYYPTRFQCVEILNYLSKKTNVYIPTASYILEVNQLSVILLLYVLFDELTDISCCYI